MTEDERPPTWPVPEGTPDASELPPVWNIPSFDSADTQPLPVLPEAAETSRRGLREFFHRFGQGVRRLLFPFQDKN